MTNEFRHRRLLNSPPTCPRCGIEDETIIHMLHDCCGVKSLWESLVRPNKWNTFFGVQLHEWILLGLTTNIGMQSGTQWDLIFGFTIWLIWLNRNDIVFNKAEGISTDHSGMEFSKSWLGEM